jgi:hypothetical protein
MVAPIATASEPSNALQLRRRSNEPFMFISGIRNRVSSGLRALA